MSCADFAKGAWLLFKEVEQRPTITAWPQLMRHETTMIVDEAFVIKELGIK